MNTRSQSLAVASQSDNKPFPEELFELLVQQNIPRYSSRFNNVRYMATHDLNAKDGYDMAIIHHACGSLLLHEDVEEWHRREAIDCLIQHQADLNIHGCNDDRTPLFHAVVSGNVTAANLLYCRGVHVTGEATQSRRGGLMHALVFSVGSPAMFESFKQRGSRILKLFDDRDIKGRTALHHLAFYPSKIKLSYLVDSGFNFSLTDYFGRTFLHLLCRNASARFLDFSCWDTAFHLSTPSIICHRDQCGRCPMHDVNHPDIAVRLHRLGGDLEIQDHIGNTPIFRVPSNVRCVYLSLGADQSHEDGRGFTCLWHLFDRFDNHGGNWSSVRDMLSHTQTNHQLTHGPLHYSSLHILIKGEDWLSLSFYQELLDPPRSVNPHLISTDGFTAVSLLINETLSYEPTEQVDLVLFNILNTLIRYCVMSTGSVEFIV
jgi:hypothetical protein